MAISNKAVVIGVGAVVAAGLLYTVARQNPVDNAASAGAIAPAERYRAEQLTSADITLGDEDVSRLMQTDAFELLVKDPDFRELVTDANFQALAANPQALQVMAQHPAAFQAMAA